MSLIRFNPACVIRTVPVPGGNDRILVIDDVLIDPEQLVHEACVAQTAFVRPKNNYPGVRLDLLAEDDRQAVTAFIVSRILPLFRMKPEPMELDVSLSLATDKPEELNWRHRMCHQDDPPPGMQTIAAVTYLFRNPRLGGTAFYRYKGATNFRLVIRKFERGTPETRAVLAETFPFFSTTPAYPTTSNEFAELLGVVPAAWNRMILYQAMLPHAPHIEHPELLSANPTEGRLTLNFFISTPLD